MKLYAAIVALLLPVFCANNLMGESKTNDIKFYNLEKEYHELATIDVKLNDAKALEIKPIIESMLSIYGSVYANEKNNTIFITDTKEIISSLKPTIQKLDIKGILAGGNLFSKVILLKHTNASDIINLIEHKLSKNGSVIKVSDQNGIIITDIESKIAEVEKLIQDLDVPVEHISIKITILELNSEYFKKIGFDVMGWLDKFSANMRYDNGIYQSEDSYTYEYDNEDDDNDYTYGRKYYNRDTTNRSTFYLNGRFILSDLVELMTRDGKGRVVASPQIVTKNNNSAYLNAGEIIPYISEASRQYGGTAEYTARTGVYVTVHPVIQKDGYISLNIAPRISDLTGWSQGGKPIVFERSLQTEVNVKNGDTFVLGGLKRTEKVDYVKGVPLLKRIPFIKFFFSKKVKVNLEREIAMFITPTILSEGNSSVDEYRDLKEKLDK